ncbi:MAG TPA: histidinol phosphate phosphatase domain-containing protein [Syntrophales bacterium]|nr:histidinol phosphate phosphatase domain-containing protein [Syntrophales bacterium]
MIDLHTHSIFSDGELIPSELARRAKVRGYGALAITDHGDHSNFDFIIPRLVRVCGKLADAMGIALIPGIEITHVPPDYIHELAVECRKAGARIIVVHGETVVEPVAKGTNRAAVVAPIDILAHPGLITAEEAMEASRNSVYLEITTRNGHSLTNGHVARIAREAKAPLILNTDSHAPGDLVDQNMAWNVAIGAGLIDADIKGMLRNSQALVKKALGR